MFSSSNSQILRLNQLQINWAYDMPLHFCQIFFSYYHTWYFIDCILGVKMIDHQICDLKLLKDWLNHSIWILHTMTINLKRLVASLVHLKVVLRAPLWAYQLSFDKFFEKQLIVVLLISLLPLQFHSFTNLCNLF